MIDVCNYRQTQKNRLEETAKWAADKAVKQGTNELLRPMTSYERKIIHDMIGSYDNLSSTSVGDEPNRRVLIKIK